MMKYTYKYLIGFVSFFAWVYSLQAQEAGEEKTAEPFYQEAMERGYTERPGYKSVSALSEVSGETLQKTFTPNFLNTLAGQLPGLTITASSDEPGMADNILRIRGTGTFTGSRDPLLVIDGFVVSYRDGSLGYQGLLSQITTEEVESVTLLKDAAATALYGLRGANGVLVITTKRGVISPLKVGFSAQVGFHKPTRLPEYLGSYDYARLYNEAYRNTTGLAEDYYSAEALEHYRTGDSPYLYPDVDWYNEVLRKTAPVYNLNLNFRGGDATTKYFVLLNYLNNAGLHKRIGDLTDTAKDQKFERYNIRSNVDVNVTKEFSAHVTLGLTLEDKTLPGGNGRGVNTGDIFYRLDITPPNAFPVYNPNGSWGGNSAYDNPLAEVSDKGYWSSNARDLNASLRLTEKLNFITPGLSVSAAISFNDYYISYSNKYKDYLRYSLGWDDTNNTYTYSEYGAKESLYADEGISSQWRNYTIQGVLNYERVFGKHDVSGLLMYTYENENGGSQQDYVHEGLGGRLNYMYNRRYIADFSFGLQATETFARNHRTGFFPAGALGWVISEEEFLKNNAFVNLLKLRVSYGLTGNGKILAGGSPRFMYEDEYNYMDGYPLGQNNSNIGGIRESMVGNPKITWEKEKKLNIGVEGNVLGNIDFSFDYFSNRRTDILCLPYRTIPSFVGLAGIMPYSNIGKTKNHGFEAVARYTGTVQNEFDYFVQLSGGMARNTLEYMSEEIKEYDYLKAEGHSIGRYMLYEAIGFYTQAEIDDPDVAKPGWKEVLPGDLKYRDRNEDGIIDQNDMTYFGYSDIPEITLGLNLGFTWKNFDFYSFFRAALNRDVYLGGSYYRPFQGNGKISKVALDRWTSEETASSAKFPRLSLNNEQNNYQGSTFWLKNGNFLKLTNLEIGYTFKNAVAVLGDTDIRVFLNGTNLFSMDHVKDFDPERLGGYPMVRTFSLGAKVQF